jgi:hypothetical protein
MVPVLAVSVQDIEIASGDDAVPVIVTNECRKVRDHAMNGRIRINFSTSRRRVELFPWGIH